MRKYCLIVPIIFLLFNVTLLGQEENNYKNLIGINAFSYKYIGKDNDYLFFEKKPNFFCGIIFSRKHKYFDSRYSINYNRFKTDITWAGPDSFYGFHYHSIWSAGFGIQKNYSFQKLNLYYGIDLYNNLILHKVDLDGGSDGEGSHRKIYDDWIGLSPIIGLQYRIFSRISLKLETCYNLQFIVYSTDYNSDTDKVQSYFNPINSLAICYIY